MYAEYERTSLLFLLVQSDAAHAHHQLSYLCFKANGKTQAVKHARVGIQHKYLQTYDGGGTADLYQKWTTYFLKRFSPAQPLGALRGCQEGCAAASADLLGTLPKLEDFWAELSLGGFRLQRN